MNQGHRRLLGLQALRAVAALLVVTQHSVYFSLLATKNNPDWFTGLELGNLGVFIFFVISGTVMALATTDAGPRAFGLARLFRIYPGYFLALAFTAVILSVSGYAPQLTADPSLLLFPSGNLNGTFEVPYWTLIYEMQFYFLLWLAALLGASHKTRIWLAVAWAGLILGAGGSGIHIPVANPTIFQISFGAMNLFFIFGYVAASALMTKDWRQTMLLGVGIPIASIYLGAWPEHYVAPAVLCVFAVLIAIIAQDRFVPRWAAKAGDWSYGLYLTHLSVVVPVSFALADRSLWIVISVVLASGAIIGLAFGACEQWLYGRYWRPAARRLSLRNVNPSSIAGASTLDVQS